MSEVLQAVSVYMFMAEELQNDPHKIFEVLSDTFVLSVEHNRGIARSSGILQCVFLPALAGQRESGVDGQRALSCTFSCPQQSLEPEKHARNPLLQPHARESRNPCVPQALVSRFHGLERIPCMPLGLQTWETRGQVNRRLLMTVSPTVSPLSAVRGQSCRIKQPPLCPPGWRAPLPWFEALWQGGGMSVSQRRFQVYVCPWSRATKRDWALLIASHCTHFYIIRNLELTLWTAVGQFTWLDCETGGNNWFSSFCRKKRVNNWCEG